MEGAIPLLRRFRLHQTRGGRWRAAGAI